jgi:hypothetical protein
VGAISNDFVWSLEHKQLVISLSFDRLFLFLTN